ncbi:MAG TPA: hypothetical protein VGK73_16660, partial [Polyangiaceae bacterium]
MRFDRTTAKKLVAYAAPLALLAGACGGEEQTGNPGGGTGATTGGSLAGSSGRGGAGGSSAGRGASGAGNSGNPGGRGGAGAGSNSAAGENTGGDPGAAGASAAGTGAAGAGGSDSDGNFGVPETTFTLPVPAGDKPALYHPDLGGEFPEVDFSTLDRLYIPAGEYRTVLLGGLPERSAERRLVITNRGGQVKVGGEASNYVFSISGGTNWVLTGRYDETSRTGDAGFRGHAGGAYANSQGSYGILIDDAFSKEGLSGLAVGGRASDFELEFLEVTRAEFAGIVVKTDDDGGATMRNVALHDLYVHDTGSEGLYLGSTQAQPQHAFENLRIHDNRFLRAGTEALQVGQLGSDCEIDHNVLGPGAVRWRSAFADYQDGNVQYGQRYGSSSFHHNVVIGTGDLFVELFPTPVDGDPRAAGDAVNFSDNYFSDTSASGVYTHADETGVTIRFERNQFRGFYWNYPEVHPDAGEPVQVFGVGSNTLNPHVLRDNVVDGPYPFLMWTFPSVTEENNVTASIERVRFRDFMGPELDENYRRLEWWTERATRHPDQPLVVYPEGAFVVHFGTLYRALAENSATPPDSDPEIWEA